jgi:hypothetical protein
VFAITALCLTVFLVAQRGESRSVRAGIEFRTDLTGLNGDEPPWDTVATFSILGFDPGTGEVGGAVQSRVFSVGNGVLWAQAGLGAVATQAIVDVSYGPQALALLGKGIAPKAIIKEIWEADPDPRPQDWSKHGRQFAVINSAGEVAAFTG